MLLYQINNNMHCVFYRNPLWSVNIILCVLSDSNKRYTAYGLLSGILRFEKQGYEL